MGEAPDRMVLVESPEDVAALEIPHYDKLAVLTQTTLSVDEVQRTMDALLAKYPHIERPKKEDICYATTNRQAAVKAIAPRIDALLVIGAPNSSNSRRLVEVGAAAGCTYSMLIQRAADIDWRALHGIRAIGLTAGASAPEVLVEEVVARLRELGATSIHSLDGASESVTFPLPKELQLEP